MNRRAWGMGSVGFAVVLLASSFAFADGHQLEAGLLCEGSYLPGEAVPIEAVLDSLVDEALRVEVLIELEVPELGVITLVNRAVELPGGAHVVRTLEVLLPETAPRGEYVGVMTAATGDQVTFSSCAFRVGGDG